MKKNLALIGMLALAPLTVNAAVVFEDDFSGDGLSGLNGTAPDVTTTGAVWEAGSGFLNDGASDNVGLDSQAAHLDLALEAGKRYIAEATILNNQTDWIAFGFTVGDLADWTADSFDVRHSNGAIGATWVLIRNSAGGNDIEMFAGGGTSNGKGGGDLADVTQPIDVKLVLDNTGAVTQSEFWINGNLEATHAYNSVIVKPIGAGDGGDDGGGIGFSHTADSDGLGGSIQHFKLTVVPEPGSLALLGLGALGLIRRRGDA